MDHIDALRVETDAFHAAVAAGRLGERVETCPDWTLADLAWHLGWVHSFWGTIVDEALDDPAPAGASLPVRPDDNEELVRWARERGMRLVEILEGADPATAVWTWAPQRDVAFVRRRMALEIAVHRWDAETVAPNDPGPIDAELAADGIDEFLTFFLPYALGVVDAVPGRTTPQAAPLGRSVHIHRTDGEGEWLIDGDGTVGLGHAKADVAVRGGASDLLLVLWRRLPLDAIDVVGDRTVANELIDRLRVE